MSEHQFLALDLGAESGRGELVTLLDGRATMEEIHRFPNRPVRLGETLYWDFPFLFGECVAALKACAHRGVQLAGVSVDTWGVDFGLLGAGGQLLGNPVHYRDARTSNIHAYSQPFMSTDDIFLATGCEPWAISSLFQLLAMKRDGNPMLGMAEAFLNMPDLFHYFLTGIRRNERSIVSTSNLMGVDGQWAKEVIRRFALSETIFGELIEPGTVLGPLSASVREHTGLGDVPVLATCGHDTSAVAAAVPGQGGNWAYLSCGTWSILGAVLDKPIAQLACLRAGFTNEYTIGSWYVCKNILGLWMVQELRRKWNVASDPWDYNRMTKEAAAVASGPLLNAMDSSLMAPRDMEEAQAALLKKTGQSVPQSRGQLVRCVLESLALEYSKGLDAIGRLTGQRPQSVYMVGGGIANKLLCQFTANACGVSVYAGADQCTALGNALGQALALGILRNPQEIRQVMRDSSEMTTYQPQEPSAWAEKRDRYARICG